MRVATKAVAFVFFVLLFAPLLSQHTSSNATSIWNGELSLSQGQTVPSSRAQDSPFCHYESVTHRRLLNPLGNLPLGDVFALSLDINLGERCVIRNTQGLFTAQGLQTLYSEESNSNFNSLYPSNGLVDFLPAPGGQYVLSAFRSTPQHKSSILSYHPSWRDDTSFDHLRKEDYVRLQSSGFTLSFNGGELYAYTYGALQFSENGRFAVVARGPTVEVIDLKLLTLTPVAYIPRFSGARLAVSNDGKYVAYGKNTYLDIVDTTTCELTYARGTWAKASNNQIKCQSSKHVTDALMFSDFITSTNRGDINRPHFSPNGSSLYVTVGRGEQLREYKITADLYTHDAEGYVAMGDSFVSGEGDLLGGTFYEPGTDEQGDKSTFAGRNLCHLSRRSYPYLMAVALGLHGAQGATPADDSLFHSVACSGAKIHNIIGGSINGLVEFDADETVFKYADNQYRFNREISNSIWQAGTNTQLSYLVSARPEIITLSIGGNDIDFGGFLASCTLPGTCSRAQPQSKEAGRLGMLIAQQKNRLVRTINALQQKSPDARIYVHGYPEIVNPVQDTTGIGFGAESNACDGNVRFDLAERNAVQQGVQYMNKVVEAAAAQAGAFYVDISQSLVGGRLCDRLASDAKRLMNGVTAGNDIDKFSVCSWRSGCLGSESYHPNQYGHERIAADIYARTEQLTAPMPEPTPTTIPLPPEFFGGAAHTYAINENALRHSSTVIIPTPGDFISYDASTASGLAISQGHLMPDSRLKASIESTPTDLGDFLIASDGVFEQLVEIPDSVGPGSHTMFLEGVDQNGDEFIVYEPIFIAFSEDDFDGDGVSNDVDSCQTVINLGIDADADGVDDACDLSVEVLESEVAVDTLEDENEGAAPENEGETENEEEVAGGALENEVEQGEATGEVVDDGSVPKGEVSGETVAGNEDAVQPPTIQSSVGVLGAVDEIESENEGAAALEQTGSGVWMQLVVGSSFVLASTLLTKRVQTQSRRYRL